MKAQTNQQQSKHGETPRGTGQPIQQRAYELFLKRGKEPGHDLDDWLQAEREVRQWQGHQGLTAQSVA
jgi:hypothetical protein